MALVYFLMLGWGWLLLVGWGLPWPVRVCAAAAVVPVSFVVLVACYRKTGYPPREWVSACPVLVTYAGAAAVVSAARRVPPKVFLPAVGGMVLLALLVGLLRPLVEEFLGPCAAAEEDKE